MMFIESADEDLFYIDYSASNGFYPPGTGLYACCQIFGEDHQGKDGYVRDTE